MWTLRGAFDALVDLAAAERGVWLDAHIADPALRVELEQMFAADDAQGYLDTPVTERLRCDCLAAEDLSVESLVGARVGVFRLSSVKLAAAVWLRCSSLSVPRVKCSSRLL